ncbi:M16 family metallopeptidase, partial [Rhizobiaceae sp. 2RAB30]
MKFLGNPSAHAWRNLASGALLLTGVAFIPAAQAETERQPEIADFTLTNGMQVVVIPDHRAPIATQMVWYKIGSADEPPGKSGIAHFFEHLMFKGTKNHKPG